MDLVPLTKLAGFFNLSLSYRGDADLVAPYGRLVQQRPLPTSLQQHIGIVSKHPSLTTDNLNQSFFIDQPVLSKDIDWILQSFMVESMLDWWVPGLAPRLVLPSSSPTVTAPVGGRRCWPPCRI